MVFEPKAACPSSSESKQHPSEGLLMSGLSGILKRHADVEDTPPFGARGRSTGDTSRGFKSDELCTEYVLMYFSCRRTFISGTKKSTDNLAA
jgi:hypothetical protein